MILTWASVSSHFQSFLLRCFSRSKGGEHDYKRFGYKREWSRVCFCRLSSLWIIIRGRHYIVYFNLHSYRCRCMLRTSRTSVCFLCAWTNCKHCGGWITRRSCSSSAILCIHVWRFWKQGLLILGHPYRHRWQVLSSLWKISVFEQIGRSVNLVHYSLQYKHYIVWIMMFTCTATHSRQVGYRLDYCTDLCQSKLLWWCKQLHIYSSSPVSGEEPACSCHWSECNLQESGWRGLDIGKMVVGWNLIHYIRSLGGWSILAASTDWVWKCTLVIKCVLSRDNGVLCSMLELCQSEGAKVSLVSKASSKGIQSCSLLG